MLVVVSFTYYSDIVYIPDSSGYTPNELDDLFINWLYDKTIATNIGYMKTEKNSA